MVSHLRFVRAFRVIDVHKGLFKQAWLMAREPKGEEHGGGKLLWRHAEPKRSKDKQALGSCTVLRNLKAYNQAKRNQCNWCCHGTFWWLADINYDLMSAACGFLCLIHSLLVSFYTFFQIITRAVDSRPGEFNWQGGVCKESSICLFTFLSIFTPYKKSSQRA